MGVLAKCWLILECYLIPDGFLKWFFLSFYINPFFLIFCQIFLWIKTLQKWILLVIFLLDQYVISHTVRILRRFLIMPRSSSKFSDVNTETEDEDVWYEVTDSSSSANPTSEVLFLYYQESCVIPKIVSYDVYIESADQETVFVCSSSDHLDDEITSSFGSISPVSSYSFGSHSDMEVISNTPSSSYTLPEDQEAADNATRKGLIDILTPPRVVKPKEDKKDSFYKLYTERMSWFDLLNQERTCGLNALLTKNQYLGGEKRILKSLESDFEMVYVAQTCLSWEALHDQYRKLEDIVASCTDTTCTTPDSALCSSTLVSRFQRFQILLERFMEDERSEKGKRYWNFIQKRSSVKSLLQVPDVSENENGDQEGRNCGIMIRATDVLKTIEKCMRSLKSFIEVDEYKPWWKESRHFSWSRSPLEDPRDYNFLRDLTHALSQKELWMKDLKGKKRCWLKRRVKIVEDFHEKDMLFAMIELKLVSRVLVMSMISTSQLQWCKQKLDNIQISHGRITRPCTNSLLFPPS